MLNIAVVGEQSVKGGGSYHQSSKIYKILSNLKDFNFKFLLINSNNDSKKLEKNIIFYNLNFLDKIFFLFYSSKILKSLLKKFKIQNRFEKYLSKNQIDLVFFLGCSRLSIFCTKINYVTYIYEFHHISRPDLPEYKEWSDFEFREDLLKINIKKSLSLIVDTKKKANDLCKYYNCYEKKVDVIPLTPNITEKIDYQNYTCSPELNIFFQKSKEYFFYPAQYWSHKNHFYILSVLDKLKKEYDKKIYCVFTGNKKNNYSFLKSKVKEMSLLDQVVFFDYLSNNDIKYLYKNCKALIMPSLVGYSSLPLYEAFYFEKPVFYTKNLLDQSLIKYVNEIDIDDEYSLIEQIINFDNNEKEIFEKVKLAKIYFDENLSENNVNLKYSNLFNKIYKQTKIYK